MTRDEKILAACTAAIVVAWLSGRHAGHEDVYVLERRAQASRDSAIARELQLCEDMRNPMVATMPSTQRPIPRPETPSEYVDRVAKRNGWKRPPSLIVGP